MTDEINTGAEQVDIDSLLAESENTETIPMGEAGTPVTSQPQETKAETAAQAAERMLKINWRGQEKEVPEATVIRGYQQTYDLDQRFKEFKEQQSQWEEQKRQYDAIAAKYNAIDQYAQQNPEWFDHVQAAYEQAQKGGPPEGYDENDPLVQANLKLQEQVQELAQWKQKIEQQHQETENLQAEQALAQDIALVRQEMPMINFDDVNEQGLSVENQIIQYGIDHQEPDFRKAALLYLHPTLVKIAEENARKNAAEEIQKQRKAGIISSGPRPHREPPKNTDIRSKSWDDLANEALQELTGG